jgi:hypothetical protein
VVAPVRLEITNKTMPKRIQLPDDFYKHDFKQLAKIEKHPRTRIRFIGLIPNSKNNNTISRIIKMVAE